MKTPEAIKKGLECCMKASEYACDHCPYFKECINFEAGNLYRDALAYINQLEARVPKWISVKDRLPEYYKDVLVIVRNNGALFTIIAYLTIGGIWVHKGFGSVIGVVTNWMPLPDAPKEDMHE